MSALTLIKCKLHRHQFDILELFKKLSIFTQTVSRYSKERFYKNKDLITKIIITDKTDKNSENYSKDSCD